MRTFRLFLIVSLLVLPALAFAFAPRRKPAAG